MRNHRENIKTMLEAWRRRRAWKRVTAVLSVVVLLSTIVSLKDYAVAVTAEHELMEQVAAQLQAVTTPEPVPAIVQNVAAPEVATQVTGGNTNLPLEGKVSPKVTDEVSPEVATQEASTPEGIATSSVGSADSFPSRGSSEAGSTEVTGNNNLPLEGKVAPQAADEVSSQAAPEAVTDPEATAPEAVDPNAPQAVLDTVSILEAPVALGAAPAMLLRAAPHYTPSNISSARPTYLKLTDGLGNPVGTVMQNDMVNVELRWEVDDATEIQVAGDYIDITLSDGLTYPEMKGTYTANQRIELPNVVIEPGDVIATYEITGNNLHIEHTQNAVDLNQAGKLLPGIQLGGFEWMRFRIEGAQATGKGTYDPCVVTINGRTAKNPSALVILDRAPRQITDVTLTRMQVNDAASTTIDYNESAALGINWSWTGYLRYITSGDYFEIELPSQLAYTGHSRTSTDTAGNEVKSECFIRESDGKWVLRITYVNVYGGYNTTSGFERVMGYPKSSLSTGRHTLRAQVAGGTSSASAMMNLRDSSWNSNTGEWRVRYKTWEGDTQRQNTDYIVNNSDYGVGNAAAGASLYVIANHDDALVKDPFADRNTLPYGNQRWYYQNVVDFESGVSNYLDAYCADQGNSNTPSGYYNRYLLTPNQSFYTASLSATQVNRLINIMSIAYPYNSLAEMSSALDYDLRRHGVYLAPGETITEGAAVSAVQQCVWNTIHGEGNGRVTNIRGADSVYANRVLNALDDYARRTNAASSVGGGNNTTQYAFAQNPVITFNGNTATVSGTITPTPLPSTFTGTFTNGSRSVQFTVDQTTGRFSATLTGVSKRDTFNLEIDGVVPGEVSVYYFDSKTSDNNWGLHQNLISCIKKNRKVNLDWQFNGIFERKVKVVKQWVDKNGNVLTTTPDADVQVTLYRRDKNGVTQTVGTVILNKANNYTYL
ncbi:MAG: hypothetical protein IJR58_07180, partial [Lachnospiraceae bacterium]|nr:hypothetical protein [Lachnospiraceae bacterium]